MPRLLSVIAAGFLLSCASSPSGIGSVPSGQPKEGVREAGKKGGSPAAEGPRVEEADKKEAPLFFEPFEPEPAPDGLVFAVPRPVFRWKPLPAGWSVRVQAAADASFAEGSVLFDEEVRDARFVVPKPLPENVPVFLRAKRKSSSGVWEDWSPAASVAYRPFDTGLVTIVEPGKTGTFFMGSVKGTARERPEHKITLTVPYALGKTEVTNALFCEAANRLIAAGEWTLEEGGVVSRGGTAVVGTKNLSYGRQFGLDAREGRLRPREKREAHPVVGLTWQGAAAFCNGLSLLFGLEPVYGKDFTPKAGADGFRLPTEAEWEYAARGDRGFLHPHGRGLDPRSANYFKNWDPYEPLTGEPEERGGPTTPAGYFDGRVKDGLRTVDGSSAFGLQDMLGNVWEWCWDRFDPEYYSNSPETDPAGPEAGDARVVRGCAWNTQGADVSFTNRGFYRPEAGSWSIGLRLARTLR